MVRQRNDKGFFIAQKTRISVKECGMLLWDMYVAGIVDYRYNNIFREPFYKIIK
ncbi:MAG: hypothetical protein LBT79_06675 [Elusimicrobiota bacterium]|jgi:hypothetical protein|nr:hypothetical protein [Elusimicrobiota bacterium]